MVMRHECEGDGGRVIIENRRMEGFTPKDALRERYPKLDTSAIPTCDLYFAEITDAQISEDGKHSFCIGKDKGRIFLMRDNQILLNGEFSEISGCAIREDFSIIAASSITRDLDQRGAFHLINSQGELTTPLPERSGSTFSVMKKSKDGGKFLVEEWNESVDDAYTLHYIDSNGEAKTLIEKSGEKPKVIVFEEKPETSWPDFFVVTSKHDDGIRLSAFDGQSQEIDCCGPTDPLSFDSIVVSQYRIVENPTNPKKPTIKILWEASSDGEEPEHFVFLNSQLLARDVNQLNVVHNQDLSRILTFPKPMGSSAAPDTATGTGYISKIRLNGEVVESIDPYEKPITRYLTNEDVTLAVLAFGPKGSQNLFYLTPNGPNTIRGLYSVDSVCICDNYIEAIIVEDGVERLITIKFNPKSQTTEVSDAKAPPPPPAA